LADDATRAQRLAARRLQPHLTSTCQPDTQGSDYVGIALPTKHIPCDYGGEEARLYISLEDLSTIFFIMT
jgi:hypothetical protein